MPKRCGMKDFFFFFCKEENLETFPDSDWTNGRNYRYSTLCCFMQWSITWNSKKQPIVPLYFTDSEYMAFRECIATPIRRGRSVQKNIYPTTLSCDRSSRIPQPSILANTVVFHNPLLCPIVTPSYLLWSPENIAHCGPVVVVVLV